MKPSPTRSSMAAALVACCLASTTVAGAQAAPPATPPAKPPSDAATAPAQPPGQADEAPAEQPSPAEPAGAATAPGQPDATATPPPDAPPAPAAPPASPPAAAAQPATTAEPAPAAAPAAASTPAAAVDSDTALIHVSASYDGAWLELRNYVDGGDWQKTCQAPCDRRVHVAGMEARITAPGMTDSNVFRLEGGRGRVLLKANGGSSTLRSVGLGGLIAGIPVTMTGMGLYGYGSLKDDGGFKTAGAIVLGVGAVTVLASLPMLALGGTSVRDGRGDLIAMRPTGFVF